MKRKRAPARNLEACIKYLMRNKENIDPTLAPASKNETTPLILNDDCLLQVFENFHPVDLVAVADTCIRFRLNAQETFKRSKWKDIVYCISISSLVEGSRMLRNFGAHIKRITLNAGTVTNVPQMSFEKSLQLVNRYSCPIDITISAYEIRGRIELLFRPLLPRLQQLTFRYCEVSDELLNALPELAPELERLEFKSSFSFTSEYKLQPFVSLQPKFPKLSRISLTMAFVTNAQMDNFLEWNPQLKQIDLNYCPLLTADVFESIAEHVPCIEEIKYYRTRWKMEDGTIVPTTNSAIQCFGQLKCLNSLHLRVAKPHSSLWYAAVLHEIATLNIPLRHLCLCHVNLADASDPFVDGIAKLEHLTVLQLKEIVNLSVRQILRFCNYLSELYEFDFVLSETESIFSVDDLLELIRNSKSLQVFRYCNYYDVDDKICIDAEHFRQMVDAVMNRGVNVPVSIGLNIRGYTASIPDELTAAHKDCLTLSVDSQNSFWSINNNPYIIQ